MSRSLLLLIVVSLGLAIIMTVLSAHIRLQDSSVGCDAAPFCMSTETSASPGITIDPGERNQGLRATHRLAASIFGILIMLVFMISFWQRRARWISSALLLLTVILALVGLKTPDPAHPIVTTTNLCGGMLLSALLYGHLRVITGAMVVRGTLRYLVTLGGGLVFVAVLSGAWVTANFAAGSCKSFLNCSHEDLISERAGDRTRPQIGFTENAALAFDPGRQISPVIGTDQNPLIVLTHKLASLVAVLALLMLLTLEFRRDRRILASAYGVALVGLLSPALWPIETPGAALIHNTLSLGVLLMLVNSLFEPGKSP